MISHAPKTWRRGSTSSRAASFPPLPHGPSLKKQICWHSTKRHWQANMVNKATEIQSITIDRSPAKSSFVKAVAAIVWKDLRAEFRSRELFSAMLVFSLLIILIFNFALELDVKTRQSVTAVVLC